jgi:hypothetical protein
MRQCLVYEKVSHICLPIFHIRQPLSYNVLNCLAAINGGSVNNAFVLKALFYIWFRCHLTQTERPGMRRQCAVPQKLQEAEKWVT